LDTLSGATTETWALPADAKSAVEITAVSCVLRTKVVVRFDELLERFHTTTSPATKFDPVTVKATSGAAIVALVGEIDAIEGIGGCTGAGLPPPQPARLISSTNKDRVNPQAFCMTLLLILPR
jgi:hypothetical protein